MRLPKKKIQSNLKRIKLLQYFNIVIDTILNKEMKGTDAVIIFKERFSLPYTLHFEISRKMFRIKTDK